MVLAFGFTRFGMHNHDLVASLVAELERACRLRTTHFQCLQRAAALLAATAAHLSVVATAWRAEVVTPTIARPTVANSRFAGTCAPLAVQRSRWARSRRGCGRRGSGGSRGRFVVVVVLAIAVV